MRSTRLSSFSFPLLFLLSFYHFSRRRIAGIKRRESSVPQKNSNNGVRLTSKSSSSVRIYYSTKEVWEIFNTRFVAISCKQWNFEVGSNIAHSCHYFRGCRLAVSQKKNAKHNKTKLLNKKSLTFFLLYSSSSAA